jgi:ADP-ribose pyrophosphatase YjhB (NUDIX family)
VARSVQATAGVAAVVDDRILLVRRADDGTWCLPGGRVEFGESITACAHREFEEETGQTVELTGLLGVYSRPDDQVHRYPDGEIVHFVGVVFEGRAGGPAGPLAGDTTETRWFAADALPSELMASDGPPIRDALSRRARPVID